MSRFQARDISLELPRGWEAQIRRAGMSAGDVQPAGVDAAGPGHGSVLHAASFALPAERGDYGSGAVEVMGGSDVLVCLLEHEPEAATTELFRREGLPRLDPAEFSPQTMQRAMPGMAGTQHFFQVAGRPFCLYVVVGSHRTRGPLVRTADAVVRSIQIDG
ncbi:MAG: hypothetical protein ACLGI8_13070 [Acidimicrobiia bacterium]|jgi:hypothetical protein